MNIIKTFLIVDGHSIAYRGFHALVAKLKAPDETPTGMIVGFLNMFFRIYDTISPDCTVIVFDAHGKTFRHELLSSYKADRKPPDNDLRIQLPLLQELLSYMGYNVVIREGVEADDTAASIAKLAESQGYEVIILSSDKDLLQVLNENIKIIRPVKNGVTGAEIYNVKSFVNEFGFSPSSMPDYLAIVGDSADNVKGIAGIGEVGAKKILAKFPTLEKVYASIDSFSGSIRKKLEAPDLRTAFEHAVWTRDNLIRLKDDIFAGDLNFLNECINFQPDVEKAEELAAKLGLARVLRRLGSNKLIEVQVNYTPGKIIMPEADVITIDYKNEQKFNPEYFRDKTVWDLKTAYYLLHPDEAGRRFPEIAAYINNSYDKVKTLNYKAGEFEAQIEEYEGLKDLMNNIDLPLIPVLNKMEDHGVRINHEKFVLIQNELESKILEIESEIIKETGVRININSSQQVSWLLFERLGFTPDTKTKGKTSYSTGANVLEKLAKLPNNTVPKLILEHRELSKMLSGFVIPLQRAADSEDVIHTTFEPAFTGTGRLSSRAPNLQNIPAFGHWADEIKSGLIPIEHDNIFISADYSQIELRILAFLSGEEKLIEAFTNNRDIHKETSSWVFNIAPQFVTPELRRTAKMINFGLLYGMSSFGLSERLNISRHEAKRIMDRYFEALPGIHKFLGDIVSISKAQKFSRTLYGRIRPVDEIPARNRALDRALINTPIQGTAADIARKAMINFSGYDKAELFLQVHDSLVCECKENDADEVSLKLCEIMKASGGEIKHLEVETKRGKSLADV